MSTVTTVPRKTLGSFDVFVAGVALVVASSTMVSEFSGYFTWGWAFVIALAMGFVINLLLAFSASGLSTSFPRAGALYDYARALVPGSLGTALAVFLGLAFYGMFAFAAAGETASGAYGLRAIIGSEQPIELFVFATMVTAVVPNLFGLRTCAWVSAALLIFMIGIRWLFGIAGFLGFGNVGAWSFSNLQSTEPIAWFGTAGVLTIGIGLAFWSFVGIEFACSLAGEVKRPKRDMPTGLIIGLVAILATSLVMGLGVTGTLSLPDWQALASSDLAAGGDAPQLAVGSAFFGKLGFGLMALASFTATLGSLTVAFATMPRILQRLGEDELLPLIISRFVAQRNPRTGAPVNAILVTLAFYLTPSLISSAVVDWVFSAAYVWILLYVAFHLLTLIQGIRSAAATTPRQSWSRIALGSFGALATVGMLWVSFAGGHWHYGSRALILLIPAAVLAGWSLHRRAGHTTDLSPPPPAPALCRLEKRPPLTWWEPAIASDERRNLDSWPNRGS